MLSPRQIKAKRILLGLTIKDLAVEATQTFKRPVGESTVTHILSRRMHGQKPEVRELMQFVARRLRIPVRELKPPFEAS
jgi:hypothetical protein